MIKIITDNQFWSWHQQSVAEACDDLQKQGFSVDKVVDVSREKLGLFGCNKTEIYYSLNK